MNAADKYKDVFLRMFGVNDTDLGENFTADQVESWDSMMHMQLITEIEDTFGILMDSEDIIELNSFDKGMELLRKYGIEI